MLFATPPVEILIGRTDGPEPVLRASLYTGGTWRITTTGWGSDYLTFCGAVGREFAKILSDSGFPDDRRLKGDYTLQNGWYGYDGSKVSCRQIPDDGVMAFKTALAADGATEI